MLLLKLIWSHYLLFAALALAVWYGGVLFTFYRNEAKKLYAQKFPKPEEKLPTVLADEEEFDLMGAPAEEYGVSTILAHEVRFMPRKTMISEEEMQGLIPDVLEEIKRVIHTVEAEGGDQTDFISLFKLITVKYPRLSESRHLAAINDWLREHCPFPLEEADLAGLWV
jgi:hypothetical protein